MGCLVLPLTNCSKLRTLKPYNQGSGCSHVCDPKYFCPVFCWEGQVEECLTWLIANYLMHQNSEICTNYVIGKNTDSTLATFTVQEMSQRWYGARKLVVEVVNHHANLVWGIGKPRWLGLSKHLVCRNCVLCCNGPSVCTCDSILEWDPEQWYENTDELKPVIFHKRP